MRQRKFAGVAAGLLVLPVALSACGTKPESTGSSGGTAGASKTVTIGVIAPLSGDQAEIGGGLRNGADLAVKQANQKHTIPGWTIKLDAQDDEVKPDVGGRAAEKLASDPTVLGVVGPLNSSVALTVAPSLSGAEVAEISPSNSNPRLTGRDKSPQTRPYKTYFRVVATDDFQGPFAARYAIQTLGRKRIAVVNDQKAYGVGLTDAFHGEASKLGATVLPTQTINPGDKDFSAVISRLQGDRPDMAYYGGEYPEASLLTNQMKSKGLDVPLMGGDGINSRAYIQNGGKATEGDYSTSLGAPTDSLASARQFVTDYQAQNYKEDKDPYGAYAFDAANALINSAKAVLAGKDKVDDAVRAAEVAAVQGIAFAGVTGRIAFDQFGDTKSKILSMYQVRGGKFVPVKTEEFT